MEILDKAKKSWVLWRLAVALFVLFTIHTLATSFIGVMVDTEWSELTRTQKWIRVSLIAQAWAGTMIAFLSNAGRKLERDELPFPDDPNKTKTNP